ncbi:MAG: D-sedoheptulose 7-phosphate isomerase [Endomicrobia bacterium]|nr:D-sedoheptulose 7-phosphate isomerase [Endomicrobiia bacterium]
MDYKLSINKIIEDSIHLKKKFLEDIQQIKEVSLAIEKIIQAFRNGKKLIVFGNGGSAADAQHMVAELVGRYKKERNPLKAMSLTTNTSTLTALGNDYGYEVVFKRQLEALAENGDIVIAITTSGNSKNVLVAVEFARNIGCFTIGFTGGDGGKLKSLVDCCICVPSKDTPRVQEVHITLIHLICEVIEKEMFQ